MLTLEARVCFSSLLLLFLFYFNKRTLECRNNVNKNMLSMFLLYCLDGCQNTNKRAQLLKEIDFSREMLYRLVQIMLQSRVKKDFGKFHFEKKTSPGHHYKQMLPREFQGINSKTFDSCLPSVHFPVDPTCSRETNLVGWFAFSREKTMIVLF